MTQWVEPLLSQHEYWILAGGHCGLPANLVFRMQRQGKNSQSQQTPVQQESCLINNIEIRYTESSCVFYMHHMMHTTVHTSTYKHNRLICHKHMPT